MKSQDLDIQIASLYRQLADLHEQRAKVQDEAQPEDKRLPTKALSCVALGAMLGVCAKTVGRRAQDGKLIQGYRVERVSDRLFRLVPVSATKPAQPKEREGERRLRIIREMTKSAA